MIAPEALGLALDYAGLAAGAWEVAVVGHNGRGAGERSAAFAFTVG